MNRREFLKKALLFTGGLGLGSYSTGLGYSYFANSEYKKLFPEVPENKVKLPSNDKTVCIIGGGLAGIQAACELSDRGFKVIVIEKTNYALGKLKAWRDTNFASKYFGKEGYSREHGLHGIWGFYKNLREFLGRHKIPLNITHENDSFYFLVSNRGIQNKIRYPSWPVPFDRFQMLSRGNLYIPSRENIRIPEEGQLSSLKAATKMWGFDYLDKEQRFYLDSISFYDWAKKLGVGNEFIKHYYDGIAEMGYFMLSKECSAIAIANFIKLGSLPADSRVDYYKYPIDKTLIEPLLAHIKNNGGEIHYQQEVTSVRKENGKILSVNTNEHIQGKRVKRCRVCGNIMGPGEYEHCPFCGAHPSMLALLNPDEPHAKTFLADYFI
ncbi:MAG: FAD-dependent oxidoreductase, partial [Leptospiraceae bacterium]|nr:FAD-dependent oxidoreductase [Leptospiraceae bacterium]